MDQSTSGSKQLVCVDDYEKEAITILPKAVLGYYISGADKEDTLKDNVRAFNHYKILPRFLRDVSRVNTELQVFNDKIGFPICVSPSAMHKLAHKDGELATAAGTAQMGSLMTLSTLSTTSIEAISEAQPSLVKWFQLYLFKDRSESLELIRRAEAANFKALVLTVDAPVFGLRRANVRNKFQVPKNYLANFTQASAKDLTKLDYIDASLKWEDVRWLTTVTTLPVLLKGILTSTDSLLAIEYGASGIVVSNHGGRQLDSAPATIDVLSSIVRAVSNRCPVFVDGGVRSGIDVFKCLALGAKAVFVGRPILWGLAVDGANGVASVLAILKKELETTMRLSGCATLSDIVPDMVIHHTKLHSRL